MRLSRSIVLVSAKDTNLKRRLQISPKFTPDEIVRSDEVDATKLLASAEVMHKNIGAALPTYVVVHQRQDELREACYGALVENSRAGQHWVAMLLQQQLAAKIDED